MKKDDTVGIKYLGLALDLLKHLASLVSCESFFVFWVDILIQYCL